MLPRQNVYGRGSLQRNANLRKLYGSFAPSLRGLLDVAGEEEGYGAAL